MAEQGISAASDGPMMRNGSTTSPEDGIGAGIPCVVINLTGEVVSGLTVRHYYGGVYPDTFYSISMQPGEDIGDWGVALDDQATHSWHIDATIGDLTLVPTEVVRNIKWADALTGLPVFIVLGPYRSGFTIQVPWSHQEVGGFKYG